MVGGDLADLAIEGYLDAVASRLAGPRTARALVLDELRDGLHEAAAARIRSGDDPQVALRAALDEFGPPGRTADAFAAELAVSRARRTVLTYLSTGPLVGVLWLLMLAPPAWWQHGPIALWVAVPPAPVIGLVFTCGVLILVATGRASRWLHLPARHVVRGTLVVVAGAILGDLLMIFLVTLTNTTMVGAPTTIGVLAVTASFLRLGFSIPTAARCLHTQRTVSRRP